MAVASDLGVIALGVQAFVLVLKPLVGGRRAQACHNVADRGPPNGEAQRDRSWRA